MFVMYTTYMLYSLLIVSLPGDNASSRMRTWRSLKALGAALLRDGVYLLPDSEAGRAALAAVAGDVRQSGGLAWLWQAGAPEGLDARGLFDRSGEFAALLADISACRAGLGAAGLPAALRQLRRLDKALAQLVATDFFPGEAQRQTQAALAELRAAVQALQCPDEPHAGAGEVERLSAADFQGRLWATRARPWVDRLACAWLIRRFIDPQARFLWLADPARCPRKALGFDFDGARFTHVGARVSFETLLASFGLETPALLRLGALVHYLDVGGVQPPEASGIERVLAGMRDAIADDDQLLAVAGSVLEGLWAAFVRQPSP
jgi:hypothetical protein